MVLRAGAFTSLGSQSKEALPDLCGRLQCGFSTLGRYDGRFDLFGQLVGIAVGGAWHDP